MKKTVISIILFILGFLLIVICISMYSSTIELRKNHLMPRQEFRKTVLKMVNYSYPPVVFVTETKETLKDVDSIWVATGSPIKCRAGIIIDFNISKMVFSISDCDDINKLKMMQILNNDLTSDELEIAENLLKGKLDQTFKIGIYDPKVQKRYVAIINMKDCNNFFIELVSLNKENIKICDRYHIVQINSFYITNKFKL